MANLTYRVLLRELDGGSGVPGSGNGGDFSSFWLDPVVAFVASPPAGLFDGTRYIVAATAIAVSVVPVLYVWIAGFRTNADLNANPAGLPDPWFLGNYATVLGSTRHRSGRSSSTSTLCRRSWSTVISMCGREGIGGPWCRTSTPLAYRAPASSNPLTNWLEADASMVT